jgi:transposase
VLLEVFYSIRSERMLMEQPNYNLLFRWFVGMEMDEPVWNPAVFSKNREAAESGSGPKLFRPGAETSEGVSVGRNLHRHGHGGGQCRRCKGH